MDLKLIFERIIKRGYFPGGKKEFGKKLDFMYALNRLTDEEYSYLISLLNPLPVEHETSPVVVTPTETTPIQA